MPNYTTGNGKAFSVDGTKCDECPVSVISPQSKALVQIYARSQRMKGAASASLHGPNLADWPARMVDAFVAMDGEENKIDHARHEAG